MIAHVVIFIQENHTTDNYFVSMAPWGANLATGWPVAPNPPASDQPHDRQAYYRWLQAQQAGTPTPATHNQFDTVADIPFYAWLAASGAFIENHCAGYGTNSTPNHLLLLGGQSPTLRNPSDNPVWDLPSILGHAGDHGVSWRAYTGTEHYPVEFYQQLQGSPNIVASDQIVTDAGAGTLPALSMVWHDTPDDEHPPADITLGQQKVWQAVDAVVKAGLWDETVFLLTWDDWGGYDDHVVTPNVEHTEPDGVQLAFGPRVALLVFGGSVKPGIDSRWSSHVSVPKTALDVLGLPALGVPRLDDAPSLADLVGAPGSMPAPPGYGTTISQPTPPTPTPPVHPLPAPPVATSAPVGPVLLRDGSTLPPPNDAPLS